MHKCLRPNVCSRLSVARASFWLYMRTCVCVNADNRTLLAHVCCSHVDLSVYATIALSHACAHHLRKAMCVACRCSPYRMHICVWLHVRVASTRQEIKEFEHKAHVFLALLSLEPKGDDRPLLRIQEKPVRRLILNSVAKNNSLLLVPVTSHIQSSQPNPFEVRISSSVLYLSPHNGKVVQEFWTMRQVHDKKLANMHIVTKKKEIKTDDYAFTAMLPCAKSFKGVKQGDEIVLFVPKASTASKTRATIALDFEANKRLKLA